MKTRKFVLACGVLAASAMPSFAQTPAPDVALQYKPSQKDVEYDSPLVADVKKCRVELEKFEKNFGFAVYDPNGLILRRYFDANGDRYIDMWRYYKNGIEVYRDIDSDFDQKIDQCRWVNTGGSRWGIDKNQDGKIDSWKFLSAEEATRVAINSMVLGDIQALQTVLISKGELETLAIEDGIASAILKQVQEPNAAVRQAMSKGLLTAQSKWTRMDASMPSLVPVDDKKAKGDMLIYEGVMTFVETGGKHGIVQVGEMIRVGDVWKLTQIPAPMQGNEIVTSGGLLLRPNAPDLAGAGTPSPQMQERLKVLEEIDKKQPARNAPDAEWVKYYTGRKPIIADIVKLETDPIQRDFWTMQLINTLISLMTYGDKNADAELSTLEGQIQKVDPKSKYLIYIDLRRIETEYTLANTAALNAKDPKGQQKAYANYIKALENFVLKYPGADETIPVLLQLAVDGENNNDFDRAKKFYKQLAAIKNQPGAVARGNGALRRLDLVGKPLQLAGKDVNGRTIDVAALKGKAYVVCFWDSGSVVFNQDLPVLSALLKQYSDKGFNIVGICIDSDPKEIAQFITTNKIEFPSIHDPNDNQNINTLAMQFGIHKTPLMFFVGRDGKVIDNDISVNDLKDKLPDELKRGQ